MPVTRALRTGDGCGYWASIGTDAWVCGSDVRPSTEPPEGETFPRVRGNRWLPFSYLVIPDGGVDAYASPEAAAARLPTERMPEGWMRRVFFHRAEEGQPALYRMSDGNYVYREEVRRLRGTPFQGVELDADQTLESVGFIVQHRVRSVRVRGERRQSFRRLDVVRVTGEATDGALPLARGVRVDELAVRRARRRARPSHVGENERWIDVDIARQIMVAYQGDRPAYVTLVSTGRRGRDHDTPLGNYRIWVKVGVTTMDDIGNADASEDYSVEAVPWVQYFNGSVGFHAAYWHRAFGRRMSHGCVNLSPRDARWLYDFTAPDVPEGWAAVHPTENEQGTVVVVHDDTE